MIRTLTLAGACPTPWKCRAVETVENQTPVFHAFPPPLEIAHNAISTFPPRRLLVPWFPNPRQTLNSFVRHGKAEITKDAISTFPPRNGGLRRKEGACVGEICSNPRSPRSQCLCARVRSGRIALTKATHQPQKRRPPERPTQARTEGAGLRLTPDWNQLGFQAHRGLESNASYRLICGLENALQPRASVPPTWS